MIHAAAPHFLWPFAVQYAAHQINLQPHVSLPETTPTLRWTGKVGDASAFRVWGSRAFVHDTSADKLSSHAVPCVFLGFPLDAPGWQFYHPTSRRVLSSQEITFDESVSYYRLFPYRTASLPPPPLFLAPNPAEPVEVAVDSGAARGAEPAGAGTGGAEPRGAEPERVDSRGAEPERVEPGGSPGVPLRREPLSPQRLREWYARRCRRATGATGPSPYSGPTRGLTECREPESRPLSPESCSASPVRTVCAGRRVSRPRPPPFPGTHSMTLRPSTAPQRVHLPSPPASSLLDGPDPESDSLRAASPTVTRFLATVVTDPLFASIAMSALVAELVDFAAACRLDYATSLVAERSLSALPLLYLISCPCCLPLRETWMHQTSLRSYAEAIEGPYSSQWQAAMDAEMASWKSTGTYVDEVPPPGANIVSGMWILRGVDFFQTFSPTPKMTTLRVLMHIAAHRDYEVHSLDISTAFLQGSLHEEIWLRRPPGFIGSFPAGTQWSLRRPVYGLRQAPREWHDTFRTTLANLGFAPSTADPSHFLRTDTTLPPFYVLVYVDDIVFATADTEALAYVMSELQKRHMCIDLAAGATDPRATGAAGSLGYRRRTSGLLALLATRRLLPFKLPHCRTPLSHTPCYTPSFTPTRHTPLVPLHHLPHTHPPQRQLQQWEMEEEEEGTGGGTRAAEGAARAVEGAARAPKGATVGDGTGEGGGARWPPMAPRRATGMGTARAPEGATAGGKRGPRTGPRGRHCGRQEGAARGPPKAPRRATGRSRARAPKGATSGDSVEPSGPYPELMGCLITSGMGLVLGGRARVVLTGHADASWVDDLATQRSSQGYTFSLGFGSISWRSTRSSSFLSSSCEAEIYAGAMAAQELRWLTYLLTDLGEAPRSPPILYVDNKAMLALCQEHRLEHRTKHIALHYFLARELQQRGQIRLAYVAA
ncbi:unnamed protein product [Closterium sp. NIES-53]